MTDSEAGSPSHCNQPNNDCNAMIEAADIEMLRLLGTHPQAYYRRGDANFALGKFKDALRDLRTVGGAVKRRWLQALRCLWL